MDPIKSSVPGRLRVRCEDLRKPEALASLEASVGLLTGVVALRANRVSGSLVIEYDPATLALEVLEGRVREHFEEPSIGDFEAAEPLDDEPASVLRVRRLNGRTANRYAKLAGLATLGASMGFAAAGKKGLHIATGGAFLGCLAVHLYIHRRRIAH